MDDILSDDFQLPDAYPDGEQPVEKEYFETIDLLRLVLMLFVSINLFGMRQNWFGTGMKILSGFAPIGFFIISGFLVLYECENTGARILRSIKRTALAFFIMLVAYFGVNALFYAIGGINIFAVTPIASKRFWFNFVILNVWPYSIGSLIWYVQALLYTYVIVYILYRLRLLKYDWLFFLILFAGVLLTGEFSGLIGFNFFGAPHLPQGFLTRALPYVLLGSFIRRHLDGLVKVHPIVYILSALVGILLIPAEIYVLARTGNLVYIGHLIGMPIVAVSVCMLTFMTMYFQSVQYFYLTDHSWIYVRVIYYILQPLSVVLAFAFTAVSTDLFVRMQSWMWIVGFTASFVIALAVGVIYDLWTRRRADREELKELKELVGNVEINDYLEENSDE